MSPRGGHRLVWIGSLGHASFDVKWTSGDPEGADGRRLFGDGVESVSGPADRRDRLRTELLTQVPHVDLDDVRFGLVLVAPDTVEDLLSREHLPLVPEEELGQREL